MPSFQRARELPSNAPETEEADSNDDAILPRDPEKLAVTSSLHPFWHTKKGAVVIVLVILVIIAAIVGGAVGGSTTRKSARAVLSSSTAGSSTGIVGTGTLLQVSSVISTSTVVQT